MPDMLPNDNECFVTVGGKSYPVVKFEIDPNAVVKLKTDKEMFGSEAIMSGMMDFTDCGESIFFQSGRLHVAKAEQN